MKTILFRSSPILIIIGMMLPFLMTGCGGCDKEGQPATVPAINTNDKRECEQIYGGIYLCVYDEDCAVECECSEDVTTIPEVESETGL